MITLQLKLKHFNRQLKSNEEITWFGEQKKTINKPVTVLQSEVSFILTQSSSAQISTNLSQNTEFKKWFNEFMTHDRNIDAFIYYAVL